MKQKHMPSVAVALLDDQHTIWNAAFGMANLEDNIPAAADTVYKIWSVAKVFTAIETMRLVEEGSLDLDAPISEYLPDFSIQSRFADPGTITIRNILTQRSGLPRNGCTWVEHSPAELAGLAASLEHCYLAFPAETRYKYSNIGFDILGYLVEQERNQLFPFYVRDKLFTPIGMKNSAFLKEEIPDDLTIALGYEYHKRDYYPLMQNDISSLPSGNLYATIDDMSEFIKLMFRAGNVNGEQIIQPETLNRMVEKQASNPNDPQRQGLGWKIAPIFGSEQMIWHDGGPSEGIGALIALIPERKLGVILFANSTHFDGSISAPLAVELLELMLEAKYGLTAPEEIPPETEALDPAALARFEGRYIVFGEVMEIFLKGGKLKGKVMGLTFNLIPLDQHTFKLNNWLMRLGLDRLIPVPIDLRKLSFQFFAADAPEQDTMIINIGDISYEICPKVPDITDSLPYWETITGSYELYTKQHSGHAGQNAVGSTNITIEDGILHMSGFAGPLLPISETELIIMSGSFVGETIRYDPETGHLHHQKFVFKKLTEN